MNQYQALVRHIIEHGREKTDRTCTGTKSVFGYQMRFNLADGFPLVTTKRVSFKSVLVELLWFLRGDTNVRWLQENGCTIWDEWADLIGDLGPVYGKQWRSWGNLGFDQISSLIEGLKRYPDSRRHVVSAWNVSELEFMALAPCHCLFQFYAEPLSHGERIAIAKDKFLHALPDGFYEYANYGDKEPVTRTMDQAGVPRYRLSCQLYQRSADVFLGVPFNIASYALLTHMIAQVVGMEPGEFIWTGGDCHLYLNHMDQAHELLLREPRELPTIRINPKVKDIDAFTLTDFELWCYNPYPTIKAEVAV